jgi:hypothetical protein
MPADTKIPMTVDTRRPVANLRWLQELLQRQHQQPGAHKVGAESIIGRATLTSAPRNRRPLTTAIGPPRPGRNVSFRYFLES